MSRGVGDVGRLLSHAMRADREGLDLVSMSDHPYVADRLDAYAALGVILGRTTNISGAVNVTNLPSRPAPMLARTVTSLSALSGGRVVLGMGAGRLLDEVTKLGVSRLTPSDAVRAMAEGIALIKALSGGGAPVTFDGEFYRVTDLVPATAPTRPIWTGAVGPKPLTVTGRGRDRLQPARPHHDVTPTGDPRRHRPMARRLDRPMGRPAHRRHRTHRAAGFIYFPIREGTPTDVALHRWAQEIVPAVRDAIGHATLARSSSSRV